MQRAREFGGVIPRIEFLGFVVMTINRDKGNSLKTDDGANRAHNCKQMGSRSDEGSMKLLSCEFLCSVVLLFWTCDVEQ